MATRSIVTVTGTNIALYKHWDGYPTVKGKDSDWLKFLIAFNRMFAKQRGVDPSYKIAQLLRRTAHYEKRFNLDESYYTGYGLIFYNKTTDKVVASEEYVYTLHDDGSVTYREANYENAI